MSPFYSQLWEIQDREWIAESPSDLESMRDDRVSDLENLKSECEDNLSNMPDHLQESSVLNERIEGMDSLISDLEAISFSDYDEPDEAEVKAELEERRKHENKLEDRAAPVTDEEVTSEIEDRFSEWLNQKIGELDDCSWDIS